MNNLLLFIVIDNGIHICAEQKIDLITPEFQYFPRTNTAKRRMTARLAAAELHSNIKVLAVTFSAFSESKIETWSEGFLH